MITLLETAFEKASKLSELEQDRFAKLFLEEIESEKSGINFSPSQKISWLRWQMQR